MEKMTYCNNHGCDKVSCDKHSSHRNNEPASFCSYPDCPLYQKFMKKLYEEEVADADREARREAYMLDENEDTLRYRHGF